MGALSSGVEYEVLAQKRRMGKEGEGSLVTKDERNNHFCEDQEQLAG